MTTDAAQHEPHPRLLHDAGSAGWLVVAKPAGWHSVAIPGRREGRVVEAWLRSTCPACATLPEAGLVNRLDQGTSGCLVVATSAALRDRLRALFSDGLEVPPVRAIRKSYLARVSAPVASAGELTAHFEGRHKRSKKVTVSQEGAPATRGTICWTSAPGDPTLLRVQLVGPGRRHQIRASLASLGAPIVGDELYGGPADPGGWPLLHAWRVEVDGVEVEAPAPAWASHDAQGSEGRSDR